MSYKILLKFYFGAERLNGVMDGATLRLALSSAECDCVSAAEKIERVIEEKIRLNELWLLLDNAIAGMREGDRAALKRYCENRVRRTGKGALPADEARAEHRALVKLSRRIGGKLASYERQVNVLKGYAARLNVRPALLP